METQLMPVLSKGLHSFFNALGSIWSFFHNAYYFVYNKLFYFLAYHPALAASIILNTLLVIIIGLFIYKVVIPKIFMKTTVHPEVSKLQKTETKTSINKTFIYQTLLILISIIGIFVIGSGIILTFVY